MTKKRPNGTKQQRKREQRQKRLKRHPPRLGHESMMAIPAFRAAATALSESLRVTPGTPVRLVSEGDFALAAVDSMLQNRLAIVRQLHGWSDEDALTEAQQLCTHLAAAVNHDLVGKKTFWVSADLAEALLHTNLDIPGDVLELPFAACAFVFNDAPTIELVRALIHRHTTSRALYRTLTVYAFPSRDETEPGFDFVFLADAYDGEWPYMIGRSVLTDGKRNLDEILESHPDGSTDELFRDVEMGKLLSLVVNAVLYTTSADYRKEWREPAPPALAHNRAILSGDGVYYLPGRIPIGPKQATETEGGTKTGTTIVKRFWVRGHWRRPHSSWQDQRVRWIAPYLKGPDVAAIVEREYALGAMDP
ncbi:MAG TPA: hypothetical protein VJV79_02270 [Polyangiaceae bacterium]|nr:hypothetical protein [Polyangiaceae bacterium]